ncbi:MAG: hypothetical protein SV377_04255 [Halobacteria archaeon]|nr:hypothetical protein [Halobacteria archaeon]
MWSHVGALLSVILVAIGVTALLYGEGVRGLGLAGLIGAGFAYVGVGATALWVPIAWEATVLAQAGSSSLGTFASLFSPLGSGYMVTVVFLFALTVAGISLGLYGSGLVHRAVAALGTALGVVTAFVMLYILSMAVPNPTEYVLLGVVMWLSLLPIGASLYMNRGASMAEVETEEATTSA